MGNIFNIFGGIILIILGSKVIIIKIFYARGTYVDFSNPILHWSIGLFFIFFGTYLIYRVFKPYKKS